jgi:hypothetical protein
MLRMPWRCPSCHVEIQHTTEFPYPECVYRCPVCRLNLLFDIKIKKMLPVPSNGDNGSKNNRDVA